jgi:hypothetical protein
VNHSVALIRVERIVPDAYTLGIASGTYSGTREMAQDGGIFGFSAMFTLPDEHLGIIFTNVRNCGPEAQVPSMTPLTRRIVEVLSNSAVPLAEKTLAYYADLRLQETVRSIGGSLGNAARPHLSRHCGRGRGDSSHHKLRRPRRR